MSEPSAGVKHLPSSMHTIWDTIASDAALPYRVAIGLSIFAVLGIVDYYRHREQATRWREYAFLALCVVLAIAYGIANDLITSRISVEYFLYFKGVADRVSGEVAARPDLHRGTLDIQAMRIGALATWSVGLIVGAALLVTNTVGRHPRLRMRRMFPWVSIVFGGAVVGAVTLGWLGWHDRLPWIRDNFAEPTLRPRNLMCVYGIHLGGYVGGAIGAFVACARVAQIRRRTPRPAA